jgi:hypothetical protein
MCTNNQISHICLCDSLMLVGKTEYPQKTTYLAKVNDNILLSCIEYRS